MVDGEQYVATSWRHHQSRRRCDGFRVPALVLLAGAIIFEGYAQLGAIGSPVYLRGSVGVGLFSGASLIVITLVDGSGNRHHRSSVRSLVAARALLVTATFVVFVLPRAVGSRTLGASDLLVALGVLVSAVLDERRASCRPPMLDHLSNLSLSPGRPPF